MSEPEGYPEDEFDIAGRDRVPQGVHRGPRPMWRSVLPILAVVVIAPLLGWGLIALLSGADDDDAPPAAEPTTQESPEPEPEETDPPQDEPGADEPDPEETDEPEVEETPEPEIQHETPIAVLNGAGVSGLAGQTAEQLAGEGFSNAVAGDYANAEPQVTTLYYNNPDLQDTAAAVAEILGITSTVESATATQGIAIVLRADFVN